MLRLPHRAALDPLLPRRDDHSLDETPGVWMPGVELDLDHSSTSAIEIRPAVAAMD
jgi:hypothetical protein